MKVLLVILSLVFTTSVFAKVNKNSSWSQIMSDNSVTVDVPQITFSSSRSTHFISVFNVCVASETQCRTKNKVKIYDVKDRGSSYGDKPVSVEYLYSPRTRTKEYCLKENCSFDDFETITENVPSVYRLDVLGPEVGDTGFGSLEFTKTYRMPSCN